MKELKFREWCDEEKRMHEPYSIKDISTMGFCNTENPIVMQYTGLKDKNGVEIYEGDVLFYKDTKSITDTNVYEVGWDNDSAGFGGKSIDDNDFDATCFAEYAQLSIVLGNVHQNAELLND